jgi:hypothetical protein
MGRITFEDAEKDLVNDYKVNRKKSHDHGKRRIDVDLCEDDGRAVLVLMNVMQQCRSRGIVF